MSLYDDLAADTLARTLWGEARGEGVKGMEAVASVVLNRVAVAKARNAFWWGNDIVQVCQKPFQFSCWNANDPQRAQVIGVSEKNIHFATAMRIARRAVYAVIEDQTGGATHYHAMDCYPHWAERKTPTAIIGHHIFYKLES